MKLKREECFLCVNSKENILLLLLDLYVCFFSSWCCGCFNVVCIIVVLTKISTFFPAPQQICVYVDKGKIETTTCELGCLWAWEIRRMYLMGRSWMEEGDVIECDKNESESIYCLFSSNDGPYNFFFFFFFAFFIHQ